MISALIIENDKENVLHLERQIKENGLPLSVIGNTGNADDAVSLIMNRKPGLVFLDIKLNEGTGFDVLDRLMPVKFSVIFTTAYPEFALRAIRYSALDYLLKPVAAEELRTAVKRAQLNDIASTNVQLTALFSNMNNKPARLQRIALPVKDGFDFVPVEEIALCSSNNDYTQVVVRSGRKYLCSRSLKEYEELLPNDIFFRAHHAHLVNLLFAEKFIRDGRSGYLLLNDGSTVEVALRRKDDLLRRFGH